jgi:hypothetical protein
MLLCRSISIKASSSSCLDFSLNKFLSSDQDCLYLSFAALVRLYMAFTLQASFFSRWFSKVFSFLHPFVFVVQAYWFRLNFMTTSMWSESMFVPLHTFMLMMLEKCRSSISSGRSGDFDSRQSLNFLTETHTNGYCFVQGNFKNFVHRVQDRYWSIVFKNFLVTTFMNWCH